MSGVFLDQIASAPFLARGARPRRFVEEHFLRLLDDRAMADRIAAMCDANEPAAALAAGVAEHSPFLLRQMRRRPEQFLATLEGDPDLVFADLIASASLVASDTPSLDKAMARLRQIRLHAALHIALCDLAGVWDADRVVEALTAFADAAVDAALRLALREATITGRLADQDAASVPQRAGLVILAMGKHGAHELDYSSDIDLIVLFDPAAMPVASGREPLDVAVRIVKDVVRVLHEQTGSGYVFRTDLRLRPDPASTPVAVPYDRAVGYYQTVGQNWERAALIKARPVAGDLELGRTFLAELGPFIWRRYFDYAAIADIHAMKRQIHAHKGGEVIAVEGHDVKLGRGGIREIEFFVQTQQLVFGGRKPALRGRATLDMLQELWRGEWITEAAVTELSEAYRFLRMVEHRLQMVEDQQTQRLPRDKAGIDGIARFCGLSPAIFRKRLTGHFRAVERHYARLFEDAPELAAGEGSLVFTGVADDPETLKTLKRLGFHRPEMAAETVRGWHFGRRAGIVTSRAREVLTELTPALLQVFGQSGDPDGALLALDQALQRMPAVVELFTILRRNAPLRLLFAEILGSAPRLSEVVVQRPHVLDALVDAEFARPPDGAALEARFAARLTAAGDMEDFLDQLRDLARAERFLVGARLFSGILTPAEARAAHADVAQATISACLTRVAADMRERHGAILGARMAVLGLGKLGSREMTSLSDLDLIIVYDAPEGVESDGGRSITASEYYARLTQRLVTALTVATKRGELYAVDLRLRPSGGKGPVAVSLDAFRAYHSAEAETWERMAITRARLVAGDMTLKADVAAVVFESAGIASQNPSLLKDIRQMRALVGKEKPARGRFDLKRAAGGLFDIEFAAQALLLRHPQGALACEGPDAATALSRLAASGDALPELVARLVGPWRLQSALAQWLALAVEGRIDPEKAPVALRRRLAQAVGLPDFAVLSGALAQAQEEAQRAVVEVLGG